MAISYESIGQVCVTCNNSSVSSNMPCKIATNNTITACADGNEIHGVVISTRSNIATVAIRGFVTLSYSGTAPTLGYCSLAASTNGKVKVLEGARERLVVHVDTYKKTVTFYL